MKKEVAQELRKKAVEVGQIFSDPSRARNPGETFELKRIIPLSEFAAAGVYLKPETGKSVAIFFYFINSGRPYWAFFIPTDSHIIGMEAFGRIKAEVEAGNFDQNFDEDDMGSGRMPEDDYWMDRKNP